MPAQVPCSWTRSQAGSWLQLGARTRAGPGCVLLRKAGLGAFGVWVRGGACRARWRLEHLCAHWLSFAGGPLVYQLQPGPRGP